MVFSHGLWLAEVKRVINVCVRVHEGRDGHVSIVKRFEQSSLLSVHLSLSYTIRMAPQGESHYRLVILHHFHNLTNAHRSAHLMQLYDPRNHTTHKDSFLSTDSHTHRERTDNHTLTHLKTSLHTENVYSPNAPPPKSNSFPAGDRQA